MRTAIQNSKQTNESRVTFFSPAIVQPKLTIGQPNDKYEQEANAMADKVMGMAQNTPAIQAKCAGCEQKEKVQFKRKRNFLSLKPLLQRMTGKEEELQTKPIIQRMGGLEEETLQTKNLMMKSEGGGGVATSALTSQLNSSKGGGSPLPASTNQFMSNAFGSDFSSVRVHTGSNAIQMNQGLGARAFTHGSDLYFNKREYSPSSSDGKRLLGHELTHVVQQGEMDNSKNQIKANVNSPNQNLARKTKISLQSEVNLQCQSRRRRRRRRRRCPTRITRNTKLTRNCRNSINIAANNIELDCDGHTLTGRGPARQRLQRGPGRPRRQFGNGITLTNRNNVTVKNCNITRFTNGIEVNNSQSNTFEGNRVFNNQVDGIDINDSERNTFTRNTSTGHTTSNGIEIDGSQNNTFTGNTLSGNLDGFDLMTSTNNRFSRNTVTNSLDDGFSITNQSHDNRFIANTVNDNSDEGFRIRNSNRNSFSRNTAINNGDDDFDLQSSIGNTCNSNSFNNPRQGTVCPPEFP